MPTTRRPFESVGTPTWRAKTITVGEWARSSYAGHTGRLVGVSRDAHGAVKHVTLRFSDGFMPGRSLSFSVGEVEPFRL